MGQRTRRTRGRRRKRRYPDEAEATNVAFVLNLTLFHGYLVQNSLVVHPFSLIADEAVMPAIVDRK
jgi:hypothetical protein